MSAPLVIVGGGLTAAKAAESARESGYDGELVVFAAERHLPYERPPLSKGYLAGSDPLEDAFVHDEAWYRDHDVDLRMGTRVTGVDRQRRTVRAESGDEQPYERLLLATGAAPRSLPMADESGAPVAYLRTIEDSDRLRAALADRSRLAVLGGGWIGLEVAAAARGAGCEVTVLEALDLPLLRVLGPEVADSFAQLHREHGVDLRVRARVSGIEKSGDGVRLELSGGDAVEADLLLVGIGASPVTSLAEQAGLPVDDGVLVDASLRTEDPHVLAAGDVARAWNPRLSQQIRVEHWDNAVEQGTAAGRALAGQEVSYDKLPYFFTDQYDLGMEYVGHTGDGYDEVVVRGDLGGERVFTAFWVKSGTVVAGMHANDWDAIDPVRSLVGTRPDLARLRDSAVSLSELAGS
ncbi:MAG TPA: FAD-dependent oxidoreductase [Nocardioidaceae bacterium]|jgi:NADPH-dependent 2,4-dienoyl-CoA reductase/sulfur reductase-like enzyme|nr:FAD-dependent oxidoreductase [Nocardioidaceae bacterium]